MARARRKTAWFAKSMNYDALTVGNTTIDLMTSAQLHDNVGQSPTIVRIVGSLLLQHRRDSGGFSESMRSNYFLGITCLHEDVISPNPFSGMDEEHWMWSGFAHSESTFIEFPDRQFDSNTIIGGSTESRGTPHVHSHQFLDLDIRAMRKAPEACELRLLVNTSEVETETGASHFISGLIRVLVKV